MKRRRLFLTMLLIISPALAFAGLSSNIISFSGIGSVKVGMSQAQAARIIGDELIKEPSAQKIVIKFIQRISRVYTSW